MIELINNHWAVEVPEGATDFGWIAECLSCKLPDSKPGTYHWISKADDFMHQKGREWQIVCTSKEVTEEEAANVVQLISNGKLTGRPQYRRYDRDLVKDTPARSWTKDARHAFETLLTSKGCDLNKNWLILKK